MKGARKLGWGLSFAIALCLTIGAARTARAETERKPVTATSADPWEIKPQVVPESTFVPLSESQLTEAERTTVAPPNWAGDFQPLQPDSFIAHRREQHLLFPQPFLDSPVFPDISARIINTPGWNPRSSNGEMDQFGYLSLYFLEIYAPIFTIRESSPQSNGFFRVNLRLPVVLDENQALAWFGSVNIPVTGTWTATGGASTFIGYTIGSRVLTAQARIGAGVDRLVGETAFESPQGTSFMYDATVGVWLGRHFLVQGQVDGRKLVGRAGATFRAIPGIRIFPYDVPTLSVGIGGLYWMDDFNGFNGGTVGAFRTRRAGAIVDIGYLAF